MRIENYELILIVAILYVFWGGYVFSVPSTRSTYCHELKYDVNLLTAEFLPLFAHFLRT